MTAKVLAIVLGTIVLALGLVAAGFTVGAIWVGERGNSDASASEPEEWIGPGMMMGPSWEDGPYGPAEDLPCAETCPIPSEEGARSPEEVGAAIHDYVQRLGYAGLEVTEVMLWSST